MAEVQTGGDCGYGRPEAEAPRRKGADGERHDGCARPEWNTVLRHLDGDPGEHDTTERCGQTGGRQDRLDRVLRRSVAIVGPAATAAAPSSRGDAAARCAIPTTRR